NFLTCNFGNMPPGSSFTVHVTSPTGRQYQCDPKINNTATVTTSNAGSAQASASIRVQCVRLAVTQTPDANPVTHGNPAGLLITVTSTQKGTAYDVGLSDTLPAKGGLSWSIDGGTGAADCSILSGVLSCSFGSLPYQQSLSVHVSTGTSIV